MDYHVFKKSKKLKNKTVNRWYYYFYEPLTGKKIQKACRGCRNQAEAYAYISSLPLLFEETKVTIATIAKYMFVPGSEHVRRLEKLGKELDFKTLREKRHKLDIFVKRFGDLAIHELTVPMVINFLMDDKRSGSWKNNFLTVVGNVYDEAPFFGINNLVKPSFPKFTRKTEKKDIFTTEELNTLFNEALWQKLCIKMYEKQPMYDEGYIAIYLMFLCAISFGLRLGEAIGIRAKQFLFDYGMFVVDGFYRYEEHERTNFNKKGSAEDQKIRVVPIPDNIAPILKNYIAETGVQAEDFVFLRYGQPIRKHLAEKWFSRALEEAGINTENRKLTPHSLRFTYITRMRREVAGETVRKIAGHISMEITDYYTRSAIPEMVQAVKPTAEAANRLFE